VWKWDEVPPEKIFHIQNEMMDRAIERLHDRQVVQLPRDELGQMLGKDMEAPQGSKFYLVRGLSFTDGAGKMRVYSKDAFLWVRHETLGRPREATSSPVVVIHTQEPAAVFVDGSGPG
jgi:hypothetical protein